MARALLGLGSNQGCPRENVGDAIRRLSGCSHLQILARSRWYRTAPIGGPDAQDEFLNGCVQVQTSLSANELATLIHEIEDELGRKREVHWGPRTLDIDLLLYDQRIIHNSELIVPHPRMSFRRFVLEPAKEIASYMIHPTTGWSVAQLLAQLDRSQRSVAFFSEDVESALRLAANVCQAIGSEQVQFASDVSTSLQNKSIGWQETGGRDSLTIVAGSEVPAEFIPALTILWKHSPEDSDRINCHGPQMTVNDSDISRAVEQAVAAIQAAWPDLLHRKTR